MNFKEKIANYVLGNIPKSEFPEIAILAIQEGIESESILILSGMSSTDNAFELAQYFERSFVELNYSLPSKYEAARILLKYYLGIISEYPELAFKTMEKIDNEIYKACNWREELESPCTNYLGSELGLEKLYTWYRELQDFQDGSNLFYFNELSREEQHKKFIDHLSVEAETLRNKIDT